MKNSYIIGVDIGGTNTDAVLVDQNDKIICAVKTTTTDDISVGFSTALNQLFRQATIPPEKIQGVFLGTTQATNAILQKKDLFRVGVIRIAGQRPEALPVAFSWPQDLKDAVIGGSETINGGLECHGGTLTPLCKEETRQAIERLLEKRVDSIAVVAVFSPINGLQAQFVSNRVRAIAGETIPNSLSLKSGAAISQRNAGMSELEATTSVRITSFTVSAHAGGTAARCDSASPSEGALGYRTYIGTVDNDSLSGHPFIPL